MSTVITKHSDKAKLIILFKYSAWACLSMLSQAIDMLSAFKYSPATHYWSKYTLRSTNKTLYFTISFILLLGIAEGKLSELKCSSNQRSLSNICLYKSNSTCCPTYNGDKCLRELSVLDWASPNVEFRDNSITVDEKRNRICVQGLKAKSEELAMLENWWSLEGFNFQVTVEHMVYLIGSNMAEFMLDDGNRRANGAPVLEDLIMCFPIGADYEIWQLKKFEHVYLYLTLIPLPPALTSQPISYQGNPVKLSSLPEVDLKTDGKCKIVSTHITPSVVKEETTFKWFKEPAYQVLLVIAGIIVLGCCCIPVVFLVLFVAAYCKKCKTRASGNYEAGVGVDNNATEMQENDSTKTKTEQNVSEQVFILDTPPQVMVQDDGPKLHSTL
ncbi:uncharacterized protein LOC142342585 isoform X2 [Convolutriloba macropyga]|uniref:uncharacterized protein LOC142342585 isoform X2 n=1 Tax=Convolutriloba macropyga TaxID=536237 RepID=UPI003F521F7E